VKRRKKEEKKKEGSVPPKGKGNPKRERNKDEMEMTSYPSSWVQDRKEEEKRSTSFHS